MFDGELPADEVGVGRRDDGIHRGRIRRAAPLLGLAARTAGEAVLLGMRGRLSGADAAELHARTAERYTEFLGHSKGALMKAGQMLSFGTAVPKELQSTYHVAFARLRDGAPPMQPKTVRVVLERELGRRVDSAFAEFEWEPLAAASIGQVHAARLHDGRRVAVKVQYPGVADAIHADLANAELLATFLSLICSLAPRRPLRVDPREVAREWNARIAEEVDYRREAADQAELAALYSGHPFIHVPDVIAELCTDSVLTQELAQGMTWSEATCAPQELRDRWGETLYRFCWSSHRRFCVSNLDPHPGNYVFHEDGSVSFLDFGCVKRYSREQVEMVGAIMRACARGDVLGTWRACVESGWWQSSDPVSPEEAFDYVYEPRRYQWAQQPFTLTLGYVARATQRFLSPTGPSANAARHFTPSPDYATWPRLELGLTSLLAHLHATNRWGSITAEYLEDAAPLTEMGKLDHAFFAGREEPSYV